MYAGFFKRLVFHRRRLRKAFHDLIFAGHRVEYIVSLSHCFFLRIKVLCSAAYSKIHKFHACPQKFLCMRYVLNIGKQWDGFYRECAVKFNDYFEFPREVDMSPYTAATLAKLEGNII